MEVKANVTPDGILQLFVTDRRPVEVHHYHAEGFYFTNGGCYVYLVDEFGNLIEENREQRLFVTETSNSIDDLHNQLRKSKDVTYFGH